MILIRHLRDISGTPFATIVAKSPNHIGVSICSEKDHYNRQEGIIRAYLRANKNDHDVPVKGQVMMASDHNVNGYPSNFAYFDINHIIQGEVDIMKNRAIRYFKNEKHQHNLPSPKLDS